MASIIDIVYVKINKPEEHLARLWSDGTLEHNMVDENGLPWGGWEDIPDPPSQGFGVSPVSISGDLVSDFTLSLLWSDGVIQTNVWSKLEGWHTWLTVPE